MAKIEHAGYAVLDASRVRIHGAAAEARFFAPWCEVLIGCALEGCRYSTRPFNLANAAWALQTCDHQWRHDLVEENLYWEENYGIEFVGPDRHYRLNERQEVECVDCHAQFSLRLTELHPDIDPCANCRGSLDPDAEYYVYLIHFPELELMKVGITHADARTDRIAGFRRDGADLKSVQRERVPNQEAARAVEEYILALNAPYRAGATRTDMWHGGWTETWHDSAPLVDLEAIVTDLRARQVRGFDRARVIETSFEAEPMALEELAQFVTVTPEEVDPGTVVNVVSVWGSDSERRRRVWRQRQGRCSPDNATIG